jgi:hypothetical protein
MKRAGRVLRGLVEAIGVYVCTLLGILLSQYAPLLLKQGQLNTTIEWARLVISAAVALYVVASDEGKGDPEGRKRNLKRRLSNAFAAGYVWNGMLGLAGQAAGG